jgi:hypothetical protein
MEQIVLSQRAFRHLAHKCHLRKGRSKCFAKPMLARSLLKIIGFRRLTPLLHGLPLGHKPPNWWIPATLPTAVSMILYRCIV